MDLDRIQKLCDAQGERFLSRVFTPAEAAYCSEKAQPAASLGARFAAKEAVMKCLGTGWAEGVGFRQIEVVRTDRGAVGIRLTGRAAEVAADLGIARVHLSVSHTDSHAVAMAVAEG